MRATEGRRPPATRCNPRVSSEEGMSQFGGLRRGQRVRPLLLTGQPGDLDAAVQEIDDIASKGQFFLLAT